MNTASELWSAYRKAIYHTSETLPQTQERECSLAFYAGMQAAFRRIVELGDTIENEEEGTEALKEFKQEILAATRRSNLDRSDGLS